MQDCRTTADSAPFSRAVGFKPNFTFMRDDRRHVDTVVHELMYGLHKDGNKQLFGTTTNGKAEQEVREKIKALKRTQRLSSNGDGVEFRSRTKRSSAVSSVTVNWVVHFYAVCPFKKII